MRKLLHFFKRIKLNNPQRIIILFLSFLIAIISIVYGFVFISKNGKLGVEYGGGVEYVVRVKTKEKINSNKVATEVSNSIYSRIDALESGGANIQVEESNDNYAQIRIRYPSISTKFDKQELEDAIINKPNLVMTDIYGNYLFDQNGNFRSELSGDPQQNINDVEKVKWGNTSNSFADTKLAIQKEGSRSIFHQEKYKVFVQQNPNKIIEFFKASSYISGLKDKRVLIWMDLDKYIQKAQTDWKDEWIKSGKDIYKFAFVDNNPKYRMKEFQILAANYLISSPEAKDFLTKGSFFISGNFSKNHADLLAAKINYGNANYNLETISSRFIEPEYGASSFDRVIIATIVIFAIAFIFLIANYGLLGVVSTLTLSLYSFLTILIVTLLKGQFSPEIIVALIVGLAISLDSSIIIYERFKKELNNGNKVILAFKITRKDSFSTVFDSNIAILIMAITLFFFSTQGILALSMTLTISIFFTILIMLFGNQLLCRLIVDCSWFNWNNKFFGHIPSLDKYIDKKTNNVNYIAKSKWFMLSSSFILVIGTIIFGVFAGINKSFSSGLNFDHSFQGGTIFTIQNSSNNKSLNQEEVQRIHQIFLDAGFTSKDRKEVIYENPNKVSKLEYKTKKELNSNDIKKEINKLKDVKLSINKVTTTTSQKLIENAFIAIAIAFAIIVFYILIRYSWTFSFALLIAMIHDGLIITSVFIFTRLQVTPIFIAGILATLIYSMNNIIVIFNWIKKEKKKYPLTNLDQKQLENIANQGISLTIKRLFLVSFITFLAALILLLSGGLTINIIILIGIIVSLYSSTFIATYLWVKIEVWRIKMKQKRISNKFWNVLEKEEQTFMGINDFNE